MNEESINFKVNGQNPDWFGKDLDMLCRMQALNVAKEIGDIITMKITLMNGGSISLPFGLMISSKELMFTLVDSNPEISKDLGGVGIYPMVTKMIIYMVPQLHEMVKDQLKDIPGEGFLVGNKAVVVQLEFSLIKEIGFFSHIIEYIS